VKDYLDLLHGAKYFSTLDLRNGFLHVPMDEQSRMLTAFIVPNITNFCESFSVCLIDQPFSIKAFFRNLIRNKVMLAYMDNLIIPSTEYETGIKIFEYYWKRRAGPD